MAHSREVRRRARERYVQGWSFRQIAGELDVGKTTLLRWADRDGWDEIREQQVAIERGSRDLLLRMLDAAQQSGDAQATFAAVHAARLAGVELGTPERAGPPPKKCAVILLDVLGKHPEIGPVVRRFRNEVVRLFLQEVERLDAASGVGPGTGS